ncbi:MAG: flippase [Patescibacteria group bacterium]
MKNSSTTKAVASNTFYQLLAKILTMSITVLATIIITRVYGKESFGEFNLMQAYPALFFVIVDFGFNAIATKELSTNWDKAEKYLSNILGIRILFSVILIALIGFVIHFFPYSSNLKFGIYLSLFLILTQALYATTNIIFQVKLRYDYSSIGLLLGYVVILFAILVLSYLRVNVVWVNFSYVVGGLVTFIVNFYYVRKFDVRIKLAFDKEIWQPLVLQALPIGLMFVFSQINFKADSILLSVLSLPEGYGLSNTESVAVYGLPYKVFEVSLVVPTFFMNAVYPIYVMHLGESKTRFKETIKKSLLALGVAGLVFGILGVILSPLAILILGGSEFTESILVLRLLLGGLVLFYLSQPISWIIVTLGKQKYLPLIYLIGSVVNLTLNFIFIPRYSFYASSVITWISEFLILIMLSFAAYKAWHKYNA